MITDVVSSPLAYNASLDAWGEVCHCPIHASPQSADEICSTSPYASFLSLHYSGLTDSICSFLVSCSNCEPSSSVELRTRLMLPVYKVSLSSQWTARASAVIQISSRPPSGNLSWSDSIGSLARGHWRGWSKFQPSRSSQCAVMP